VFRVSRTHYKYKGRKSCSDTKLRRVDDILGHLVISMEQAAELATRERQEAKRQQEEWQAQERKRLRGERLIWYHKWLAQELKRVASDRATAQRLRAFLEAWDRTLIPEMRNSRTAAWHAAATNFVTQLDPLSRPETTAREMEPSDDELADLVAIHANQNKH
jgi:hypothetical protein